MKKILALLLAMVMVIGLVACGDANKPTEPATEAPATEPVVTEPATEAPVEDVTEAPIEDVTEAPVVEEPSLSNTETILLKLFEVCPMEFSVMTWKVDLNDADAVKAFAGLDSTDGILEISVTEPAMSSQAYSVVMVKVEDGVDADAVADAMFDGIDPRKWVCVEADLRANAVIGNYAVHVMMSSELAGETTVEDIIMACAQSVAAVNSGDMAEDVVEDITEAPVEDATEAPAEG